MTLTVYKRLIDGKYIVTIHSVSFELVALDKKTSGGGKCAIKQHQGLIYFLRKQLKCSENI